MQASRRLWLAAAMALASHAAVYAQAPAPSPAGVLVLSTSASVEVTRDMLTLLFNVQREGNDAAAVQSQLKQALDAALAEARKAARPGQLEVQTGNFALYPRYAPKVGAINGWQGNAELVVEGRDATAVAQLVGRITTLTVARANWGLSREAREKVEADVAAQAIARWRSKAEQYAKQFGYAGYAVREVQVASGEPPGMPVPMMRARASAMVGQDESLPVEAGKATVTATVSGSIQMK